MEGKEGKEYKPSSLHQIMRRLCFFPTLRSSRAGIPKSSDKVLLDSNALGLSAHRHRQSDTSDAPLHTSRGYV
jgi:hypothetical protein